MILSIPRDALYRKVFLIGLALVACCLPLSRFVLSVSQFLLLLNWIIEGRFREKAGHLVRNPAALLFASVFMVYVAGLLYTENLDMGAARIKNALPILLFPIITATSQPLSVKHTKWILLLFSGAVMVASMICMGNYFINGIPSGGDFRSISVFMLHIRFSLMVVMAILILMYLAFYNYFESNGREQVLYIGSAILLIAFLFFLRSITGIVIFVLLIVVFTSNFAIRSHSPLIRYSLLSIVIISLCAFIAISLVTYVKNFHAAPVQLSSLEDFTKNGNRYSHDIENRALENGNYTGLYVCDHELKKEWNKISLIPYDGLDLKGQQIHGTLKRYLTSLGLRKDSAALHKLEMSDIRNIEKGLANYKFSEDPGIVQRFYEALWEIHILVKTNYVQHHSLGQRVAFVKVAGFVFRENRWFGVGTGDVYDSMLAVHADGIPEIDPSWEGKPHNQYVFFLLAFGFSGLLWITWCLIFPVIGSKAYRTHLFNLFAGIMLISMLTLDTLESYDNMVFFAFFYTLFVFGIKCSEKK